MGVIQDIIGSIVLGGIILVMVLGFNGNITESAAVQTFNSNVQSNLTTVTNILERDLRLLGYRISDSLKVSYADSNKIVFKEDFDDNGTVDSIAYYIGTTRPAGVVNPRVRFLYRRINASTPQPMNVGITSLRFWYYDGQGNTTTTRSNIRIVKVAMGFESTSPYNQKYSGAYWERTIQPRNLK